MNEPLADQSTPTLAAALGNKTKRTEKREVPPNRKWKKRECATTDPDYSYPEGNIIFGPTDLELTVGLPLGSELEFKVKYCSILGANEEVFAGCETPTDIFMSLLEPAVDNIVFQSNLYATQKGKNLQLKEDELYAFIGINFFMGYHSLSTMKLYWAVGNDVNVPIVGETMSRDRLDIVMSNIHVNNNHLMPVNNKDKLYKLRPMIDTLNNRFDSVYWGSCELSVDESMILFKGRSSIKQYNPMKPIKRGYKLWCLGDQSGYI